MHADPLHQTHVRADRLLMGVIWALAALSFCLAPWHDTWGAALMVAIPAAVIPSFMAYSWPGSLATRLTVATSLMVFCALHIHQSLGMTELHFGIFVLLAFLLCYCDWRPIVMGAAVAAVHHLSFNYLQQNGFGLNCFTKPGLGIVLTHAAYVVIESAVLSYLAIVLRRETVQAAELLNMLRAMGSDTGRVNLSVQASSSSVAGRAFSDIVGRLREVIDSIRTGTDTVAEAASSMSTGSDELSSRTQVQASALTQTTDALDQLTGIVRSNEDQARHANGLVESAVKVAARGGDVVSQVVATMGEINRSSSRIADIIGVIDEIAFQTNLLALNAAVEAARAGDQGRGFAVVASEVRSLAQRSATAAREIKTLIDTSVQNVSVGSTLVDQAGATMTEVVNSVQQVTSIVREFHKSAQQQTSGIDQVNRAVSQMEAITQQNVTLVESMARSSEQLREQGAELIRAIAVFEAQRHEPFRAAAPATHADPPLLRVA